MRRILLALSLVACLLAGAGMPAVRADAPMRHTLRWGETLSSVARFYGVSLDALLEANDLPDRNRVFVGQELVIPPAPAGVVVHTVTESETLWRIAAQYSVTVQALVEHNSLASRQFLVVGQRLRIPAADAPAEPPEPPTAPAVILLLEPAADNEVQSPVRVSGWGSAPRNVLAVDVLDAQGRAIGQADLVIEGEVGAYGPFAGEVRFEAPDAPQLGRIQVYSISPRDGAIEYLTSVTVRLLP